jgi:hypothetical protein
MDSSFGECEGILAESGGKNFNWARRCDHCGASLSGSLDNATTSSEASPENVADIDPPKIPTDGPEAV